jgi:YD repeat-containing protein
LTVNPPAGGQVSYLYVGNTTQATDPDGKKKLNYYNEAGKVIKVVDENANGSIDVNNPDLDYTTTYQYDLLGRLTQVVRGVQTRSYMYDSLGRKISETNSESGMSLFAYDDNGNMTQKTDARGTVTSYYYDALNRLVLTGYSDSTMWSVNAYDETTSGLIGLITGGKGRLTSSWTLVKNGENWALTTESVGYRWTYDENGRVLQQVMWMDGVTYPVSYNYSHVRLREEGSAEHNVSLRDCSQLHA